MRKLALTLTLISLLLTLLNITGPIRFQEAKAQGTTLAVSKIYNVNQTGTLLVNITVSEVSGMFGWIISLQWDPSVLQVNTGDKNGLLKSRVYYNIYEGDFMKNVSATSFSVNRVDNATGNITNLSCFFKVTGTTVSGSGLLATINFTLLEVGTTAINVTYSSLINRDGKGIDHIVVSGLVTDQPEPPPPPIWTQFWFQATLVTVMVVVVIPALIIKRLSGKTSLTAEDIEKIMGYEENVEGEPLNED
ncbi:MAG: hypothetical protein QXJ11_06250 [Candidatus Bathyarchaeia archaeon]